MLICKGNKKGLSLFVLSLLVSSLSLFSQSMPEMPSMPTISLDGSFYKPSFPYVPDPIGINGNDVKEDKTVIKENKSEEEILNNMLLGNNQTLTASDISSLSDFGLFTDVTSLFGINNNTAGNQTTNVLLQQVLTSLNELKKEQQNSTNSQKEENSNNQKDSENFKERNPSVLRFKINDYDIKDSLEEVFLSKPSSDGSFLLTGDRRYIANGKTRTETFYLLFTPGKNGGSNASYDVDATVNQDYTNENSFIYKLCKKDNLTAQKTGNLVVLKVNDKNLKVDLLIDIDKR